MSTPIQNNNVQSNTVHLGLGIQPIYSDKIFQIIIENGVAKILFAHQLDNDLIHNATVALPVNALLALKTILNMEEFDNAVAQEASVRQTFTKTK